MNAPVPQPGLLDIAPYVPGESSLEAVRRVMKLSSNEGAFGPSPKAIEAYRATAAELHRYPDGDATALRQAIGRRHGVNPERVVCGAGSDELLYLLARCYVGPGDEILTHAHAFSMYPIIARVVCGTPVAAPETDLTVDVDAMLAHVTERTRAVYLANPNNPTGSYIPAGELARLRAGLRDDILLVVDAAYGEYVTRNDYSVGYELVEAGANTVVTRSFSKAYGLGGARLGWAYCPPAVADVLNRVRAPFNVSRGTQAAGVAALEDIEFIARVRDHNAIWLPWTANRIRAAGLTVHPSVANFVLVEFPTGGPHAARAASKFLKSRGIIARGTAVCGLPQCLRITIGREEEMRAVVEAVTDFMG
jgi:histidinol-phosphate aminotransferase